MQRRCSVVVLCCVFYVSFDNMYTLVHIIFGSVKVAEWLPFRKEMLTRLSACCLCIRSICNFSYFLFRFGGHDFGSDCTSALSMLPFNFYMYIQN